MIIQHNMTAANTNRQLNITNENIATSSEKLSSGYRINRAADDAAGLTISEKLRGQIRGLNKASDNAQNGISLIQTAEGALNETEAILQRMRELTVQAANDTNVTADRKAIAAEVRTLTSEITRIAEQTEFNTLKLLSGKYKNQKLQVGANTGQLITVSIKRMTAGALGVSATVVAAAISTAQRMGGASQISKLISIVNTAIQSVSKERSKLGALQNRLEHVIAVDDNTAENLQSSESIIRDVNMADEMVNYSKEGILQQAAQSMLAQANQSTQGVLSLLG